jgi:hypothetical protein
MRYSASHRLGSSTIPSEGGAMSGPAKKGDWRAWPLCVLAALPIVAGAACTLLLPRPGVTEAACGRIEQGMTRAEVYAILGGPPGDYRTGPPDPLDFGPSNFMTGPLHHKSHWRGDDGDVSVGISIYGDEGVIYAHFSPREGDSGGFAASIRRRIRRWFP